MNSPCNVYLFGAEKINWALDTDFELTHRSLRQIPDLVKFTSLEEADVVHSVWEVPLFRIPAEKLHGKRIICHVSNDFFRISEQACMARSRELVGQWVAMSQESRKRLVLLGLRFHVVPYSVDTEIFQMNLPSGTTKEHLRARWSVPRDRFIVSNFMRDSLGADLSKPKEQKGVELLLATLSCLAQEGLPVHVLLAGPRRHWVRSRLRDARLPFTFIGQQTHGDDIKVNILSPEIMNLLYHLSDLHLITSRWEGGPRAVLEAAATRTPVISTPVGVAPDILEQECLYSSADQAVDLVVRQIRTKHLSGTVDRHLERIRDNHTVSANIPCFRTMYEHISDVPTFCSTPGRTQSTQRRGPSLISRLVRHARHFAGFKARSGQGLTIGLWHEFHKPPYGGGNQFMMALKKALQLQGVRVVTNRMSDRVDVHICNSAWFDIKKFEKKSGHHSLRMIQRIDGPVSLYRGSDRSEDDRIFSLNARFASATVFQSAYCYRSSVALGYQAVRPVIIHNSVNSDIFHARGRIPFSRDRKIRLISSSWSDNPRKGGPFYKWLDERLDWDCFEYTFVGRVQQTFEHIRHLPPRGSEALAALLRKHDIYVTASENEPCSNALLEALACGLPALYRNGGGSSELVGFGGLAFENGEEFVNNLERMVGSYEMFQSCVTIKDMDEIASRYIELAREILEHQLEPRGVACL